MVEEEEQQERWKVFFVTCYDKSKRFSLGIQNNEILNSILIIGLEINDKFVTDIQI